METQTFRAATMIEALQMVQKELGADAIVVSMRELEAGPSWQLWRKPSCEVVAARPQIRGPKAADAAAPELKESPARAEPAKPAPVKKVVVEKAQSAAPKPAAQPGQNGGKVTRPFKPQTVGSPRTSTMTWVVTGEDERPEILPAAAPQAAPAPAPAPVKPFEPVEPVQQEGNTPLAKLRTRLLGQGIDETLISRLNQACIEMLSPARLADAGYVSGHLKKQVMANLRPAGLNLDEGHNLVCLIGASGSGKTSICAKLAAYYALQKGKRVAWIEANTVRTGAIAEARMITDSLGVEFYLAYTPEDLTAALKSTQEADLVLVDTAGCNPRRESSLVELGGMITKLPRRITLLATPATTKETDLKNILSVFSPFQIDGFVVTKMDEATTFGSIYNLSWRSKVPVVYYSTGSSVMDELRPGSEQLLVTALFNQGI